MEGCGGLDGGRFEEGIVYGVDDVGRERWLGWLMHKCLGGVACWWK